MKGNVETLPKWAQAEIARLEQAEKFLEAKLAAGPDDSNTFIEGYGRPDTPLGDSPSIGFRFGDKWGESISCRIEGDRLVVHGGSTLTLTPSASNSIYVRVKP